MSPQNHQKCDLMFTLPKSDILHFNQSQVQNRHKGHRTKCQMTFPHVLRRDNTWGTPPKVHKSTLPLTEEGVPHQAHLVFEKDMFAPWQGLGENICNLIICRNVLKLNDPSLNPISDEVVSDLNMLRPVMKHWILREFYATLIITMNQGRSHLLSK
jgi:hypothetical protein